MTELTHFVPHRVNGWRYFTVVTKHMPFGGLGFESSISMVALFTTLAGSLLVEAHVVGEYASSVAAWTAPDRLRVPGT